MPTTTTTLAALGIDIDATRGDIALAPNGDLATLAGTDVVRQKLYLACMDLLQAALEKPFTPQSKSRLEQQVQERMATLPEVSSVGAPVATMTTTQTGGVVQVDNLVSLIGGLVLPITLQAAQMGGASVITTGSRT